MQDKLIEEVQNLNEEVPQKKRKPSEFIDESGTINEVKLQMLVGLQDKNTYNGTYKGSKAKRRAKNKVARASRRKNR